MGLLTRAYRNQVDASPNQMSTTTDPTRLDSLVELSIDNTANSSDAWIRVYDDTSGTVNLSTSTPVYGPKLVVAQAQTTFRDSETPLSEHARAITVVVTTTATGTSSPTNDVGVEIQYLKM